MADASDSKSDVGDHVWVQVPSPAVELLFYKGSFLFSRHIDIGADISLLLYFLVFLHSVKILKCIK